MRGEEFQSAPELLVEGTQLTKRGVISLEYATQCFCDDEMVNQGS